MNANAPITHVVQAFCGEFWADCQTATSQAEAERLQAELVADNSAWMPCHHGRNAKPRRTRIVAVEDSNCALAYSR